METEKSHALPFVNWNTRKTGGVVQDKSEGQRTVANSQTESERPGTRRVLAKAQEMWPLSLGQERIHLSQPSRPNWALKRLADAHTLRSAIYGTQFTNLNGNFFWRHPHRYNQWCFTSHLGLPWSNWADRGNEPYPLPAAGLGGWVGGTSHLHFSRDSLRQVARNRGSRHLGKQEGGGRRVTLCSSYRCWKHLLYSSEVNPSGRKFPTTE